MSDYKKNEELASTLSRLAKKYKVTFVTATQQTQEIPVRHVMRDRKINTGFDIIYMDHLNIIGE